MSAFKSVRKYLSFLSLFFFVLTVAHLSAVYVFEGSKTVPERWGAISIGFVGSVPSLSPAQFRSDPIGDFTLRFLYRSLLRYDVETRTMQGDLANCDLWKNFSEIRCFFKDDSKWSDGTPITRDDVVATYALFSETDVNKHLQSALAKTTVQTDGEAIVFKTANPNVDLLDVFTVPIISEKTVAAVRAGTYRSDAAVFSGPYVFEKRETEEPSGIERVVFAQNAVSGSDTYVSKYVFRFFPDKESLSAAKDSLNVVYPSRAVGSVVSPRFASLNLSLPEYVGLFANVAKTPPELRALMLSLIGNSTFQSIDPNVAKIVKNPFFTDESIVPTPETKNPEELLAKLGYFKKSALEANVEKTVRSEMAKKVSAATNQFFSFPTKEKTFVGGDSDELLISGSVPEGVNEVFINSYRLQGFVPKSGKFYYRAKISIGTMKEGENRYVLSFTENGKRVQKETLTIEFIRDATAREARKAEITSALAAADETGRAAELWMEGRVDEAKAKYASLAANTYYDVSGKPLTVNLQYVGVSPEIPKLAEEVAGILKNSGFTVETREIAVIDFNKVVREGKKEYDLLITGVNLGLLGYNVFPFFHSGQAETGFNFSKIKNPSLDVLLEELKSKDLGKDGLKSAREKILAILRKEAVTLTFSSPYIPYSIDRRVKNVKIADTLPATSYLFDVLRGSYVKESRLANLEEKGIAGFSNWLSGLFRPLQ